MLERSFKTEKPNMKWATDVITEFTLFGVKLYLSPIIIYTIAKLSVLIWLILCLELTMDMLKKAFKDT